jgi:hypothetical protein
MARPKATGGGGRQPKKSVDVEYDDSEVNSAGQRVAKQEDRVSDDTEHHLKEFLLLIANLAARRWYRIQAEQRSSAEVQSPFKEPSCDNVSASQNESASRETPSTNSKTSGSSK